MGKNGPRNNSYIIKKLFLIPLIIFQTASAIDTGKMAGRVFDNETGDALPGANVIILETTTVIQSNL